VSSQDIGIHEVTFCSRIAKWSESIFESEKRLPFHSVEIEETKGTRRKRSDLRTYDKKSRLVASGEVKLPGTPEGRDPYSYVLVEDAFMKASNVGAQFFFTWNVNRLVLYDSKLWQKRCRSGGFRILISAFI
jgi:hypothetical protein